MRRVLWSFSHSVLLAVVASAVACDSGTDVSRLVEVSVSLSRDSLAAADSLTIRVTATNRSWRELLVSPSDCPEAFVVLDGNGSIVGPAETLCALVLVAPIALAPNESYRFQYDWDGHGLEGPLPSGGYFIVGRVETELGVVNGGRRRLQVVR